MRNKKAIIKAAEFMGYQVLPDRPQLKNSDHLFVIKDNLSHMYNVFLDEKQKSQLIEKAEISVEMYEETESYSAFWMSSVNKKINMKNVTYMHKSEKRDDCINIAICNFLGEKYEE